MQQTGHVFDSYLPIIRVVPDVVLVSHEISIICIVLYTKCWKSISYKLLSKPGKF